MSEFPGRDSVVEGMGCGLDEDATDAEDIVGEEIMRAFWVGDVGMGEFTRDPSGLWAGVDPPEEDSNRAGVTQPLRPPVLKPSCSSAVARATAYSLARAYAVNTSVCSTARLLR